MLAFYLTWCYFKNALVLLSGGFPTSGSKGSGVSSEVFITSDPTDRQNSAKFLNTNLKSQLQQLLCVLMQYLHWKEDFFH